MYSPQKRDLKTQQRTYGAAVYAPFRFSRRNTALSSMINGNTATVMKTKNAATKNKIQFREFSDCGVYVRPTYKKTKPKKTESITYMTSRTIMIPGLRIMFNMFR